jgi:hypothetical protein
MLNETIEGLDLQSQIIVMSLQYQHFVVDLVVMNTKQSFK